MIPTVYAVNTFAGRDELDFGIDAEWVGDGYFEGTIDMTYSFADIGTLTDADIKLMFGLVLTGAPVDIDTENVISLAFVLTFHTEPATQAIYDLIADGTLVLTITLTVIPN